LFISVVFLFSLSAQVNSGAVKEHYHASHALLVSTKVTKMQLFATTALPVTPRAVRQMSGAFLAFQVRYRCRFPFSNVSADHVMFISVVFLFSLSAQVNSGTLKVQLPASHVNRDITKVTKMRLFVTTVPSVTPRAAKQMSSACLASPVSIKI
jgi:hypothetical protein